MRDGALGSRGAKLPGMKHRQEIPPRPTEASPSERTKAGGKWLEMPLRAKQKYFLSDGGKRGSGDRQKKPSPRRLYGGAIGIMGRECVKK